MADEEQPITHHGWERGKTQKEVDAMPRQIAHKEIWYCVCPKCENRNPIFVTWNGDKVINFNWGALPDMGKPTFPEFVNLNLLCTKCKTVMPKPILKQCETFLLDNTKFLTPNPE